MNAHSHERERASSHLVRPYAELLEFRAPYVEQKLLRCGVAQTREEAGALFSELKRYFVLSELHRGTDIPMFSARVDEAWHQFILFTREYACFCERFGLGFIHHTPTVDPAAGEHAAAMSIDAFREHYASAFGPISDHWRDELWIAPSSRLRWAPWVQERTAELRDGFAHLVAAAANTEPFWLCRTQARALSALQFLAATEAFFVRELPELRSHDEQLALCRPLVRLAALSIAP